MILTVDELAKVMKVSTQTLYRNVRSGKLPHIRIGASIRFDSDDIKGGLTKVGTKKIQRAKKNKCPKVLS